MNIILSLGVFWMGKLCYLKCRTDRKLGNPCQNYLLKLLPCLLILALSYHYFSSFFLSFFLSFSFFCVPILFSSFQPFNFQYLTVFFLSRLYSFIFDYLLDDIYEVKIIFKNHVCQFVNP